MTPDDPFSDDEARARDAVRRLPPVPADAAFRARLRRNFASGRLGTGGGRRWWLAAASLLLVAGAGALIATRAERWTLVATSERGVVEVAGRRIPVTDRAALAAALVAGARVVTDGEAEVQLQGGDALVLVVTPGSVTTLPALPGSWVPRTLRARLEAGEVRGAAGARFSGYRLVYDLPAATVEVTGTIFAVLGNDEGSCVCVLDGAVTMAGGGAPATVVPPGRRRVVPPSGGAPIDEEIRPMERMKLEMLRGQVRDVLR